MSSSLPRLRRRLHPGDNPLVRRWDRIESHLLMAVVVLAVLAVPVLATVGSSVYTERLGLVAEQQASRYPARAVLLEDAPDLTERDRGSPTTADVRVSWVSANGIRHEARVPAQYGAVKGTTVDVWLDTNGNLSPPPLTHRDAATFAVTTSVGAWLAAVLALIMAFLGARTLLNRARYADWEREWQRISGESTWP